MIKSNRGMATIEALPLLVIFLVLIGYGLGLFGVIHTAILHSIAARTYAFETFRNRTNLNYHRDNTNLPLVMARFEHRFHFIQSEKVPGEQKPWVATDRPIAVGREVPRSTASLDDHNRKIFSNIPYRNRSLDISPVWIMVGYGMCLNESCGGD